MNKTALLILMFITSIGVLNAYQQNTDSGLIYNYAYDSGDHVLMDGWEYYYLAVSVCVQGGDGDVEMSASGRIRLGNGLQIYASVLNATQDIDAPYVGDFQNGLGDDSLSWYWRVDARDNPGYGFVNLQWNWKNYE